MRSTFTRYGGSAEGLITAIASGALAGPRIALVGLAAGTLYSLWHRHRELRNDGQSTGSRNDLLELRIAALTQRVASHQNQTHSQFAVFNNRIERLEQQSHQQPPQSARSSASQPSAPRTASPHATRHGDPRTRSNGR